MMQVEVYGGLLIDGMEFLSLRQANLWLRDRQDVSELRAVAYKQGNVGINYVWSGKLQRLVQA